MMTQKLPYPLVRVYLTAGGTGVDWQLTGAPLRQVLAATLEQALVKMWDAIRADGGSDYQIELGGAAWEAALYATLEHCLLGVVLPEKESP